MHTPSRLTYMATSARMSLKFNMWPLILCFFVGLSAAWNNNCHIRQPSCSASINGVENELRKTRETLEAMQDLFSSFIGRLFPSKLVWFLLLSYSPFSVVTCKLLVIYKFSFTCIDRPIVVPTVDPTMIPTTKPGSESTTSLFNSEARSQSTATTTMPSTESVQTESSSAGIFEHA